MLLRGLFVMVLSSVMYGSEAVAQQIATASSSQVQNIKVEQGAGGLITITYDLAATPGTGAYSVFLEVSADQGKSFDVKAASVAGDLGSNVPAGVGKTIVWESGKDVEQVQLERFRIRINVTPVVGAPPAKKGNRGLIIGVAAGGAAAAAVLAGSGGDRPRPVVDLPIPGPIVSPSCSFSVSPGSINFTSGGGILDVQLTVSPSGCSNPAWTITSPSFIEVRSASPGSGSATLSLFASPNLTPSNRTGNLVVGGQTVSIAQSSGCTYDVDFIVPVGGPRRTVVDAVAPASNPNSLRRTINVRSSSGGCTWDVQLPNVPWIAFDRVSGTGTGTVVSLLQTNPGAARETTFTIAGLAMTVRQCAAGQTPTGAGECP